MVILGTGKVIQGFDEALMGMKVNEEKEIVFPPEKAYGKTGKSSDGGEDLAVQAMCTRCARLYGNDTRSGFFEDGRVDQSVKKRFVEA